MRTRSGMTLIELVLALTISTMLTVAAMGVVANLARAQSAQKRAADAASLRTRLHSLLAADLRHAERYRALDDGFEFSSAAALDPEVLEVRHLKSTVSYTVLEVGPESWLVRRQQSDAYGFFTELVCPGVVSVRCGGPATDESDGVAAGGEGRVGSPAPPKAGGRNVPAGWTPVSRTMRVVLELETADAQWMDLTFDTGW